jgi:5-formyltetrahydrofolate cyclo-ligase
MPASLPDKAQLRARMRERRRALTAAAQHTAAEAAAHNATGVPGWERASRIAVYLASDGEIDTTPLARFCRNTGKQLLLPVITADRRLDFYFWNEGDQLFPNRFGIPEPATTATRCAVGELDIIVMPLVAWDRTGTRLEWAAASTTVP